MNNDRRTNLRLKSIPRRKKSDLIDFSFDSSSNKNDTILDLFDPLTNEVASKSKTMPAKSPTSNNLLYDKTRRNSSCSGPEFDRNEKKLRNNKSNIDFLNSPETYCSSEWLDKIVSYKPTLSNRIDEINNESNNVVINDIATTNRQLDRLSILSHCSSPSLSNLKTKKSLTCSSSHDLRINASSSKQAPTSSSTSLNSNIPKSIKLKSKLNRKCLRSNQSYVRFTEVLKSFREKFKYSDPKYNPGLVFGSTINISIPPDLSVKLIITSPLVKSPIVFTCNVSTTIEHIISHVVCSMFESLSDGDCMENYLLKITGKDEFLDSKKFLGEYTYVNHCCKFGYDLQLTLIKSVSCKRSYQRSQKDDFRCKSLLSADDLLPRQVLLGYSDLHYESLSIIIDAIEKGAERVLKDLRNPGVKLQPTAFIQVIKALCSSMMNCETLELTEARSNFFELCKSFNDSQVSDEEDREKLLETIQTAIDKLLISVIKLLKLVSNSLPVDFEFETQLQLLSISPKCPKKEIISTMQHEGEVSLRLHSICQLKPDWTAKYSEFTIDCAIKYSHTSLCDKVTIPFVKLDVSFFPRILLDKECFFDIPYASLPREARLVITLSGVQIPQIGQTVNQLPIPDINPLHKATSLTSIISDTPMYSSSPRNSVSYATRPQTDSIQTTQLAALVVYLYDDNLNIIQGNKLLHLHTLEEDSVDDMFFETIPCREDPIFLLEFPSFEKDLIFKAPKIESLSIEVKDFECLDCQTKLELDSIINDKLPNQSLTIDERELIWTKRYYLTSNSVALPRFLQSVPCWSVCDLDHIYKLVDIWKPMNAVDAMQLLLPEFPDCYVRSKAVGYLSSLDDDQLCDFVPQLLQALRYEKSLDCSLFWLIMDRAMKSIRFANLVYWQSKINSQDKLFNQRSETLKNCLLWISGSAFWTTIDKQEELLNQLQVISEAIHETRDSRRMVLLHKRLELVQDFLMEKKPTIPYMPSFEACDLNLKSCSYFPSNALPLKIAFKSYDEQLKVHLHETIFKSGDDLRQDMLAIQMIRIMEKLWLREGLNLRIVTYDCLATSAKQGLVEVVQNAETLRKIQQSRGLIKGPFEKRPIVEWLQARNTSEFEYDQARDNFTHSCAGYAIATYLLGICDRHNDNIMVTASGHLFHIDFGKFLGDAQMMGSIKRDRTPFVLTADMAYVINDGDKPSKKFQKFVELCTVGFNILRRNRNLFLNLFALLMASKIHGINKNSVKYIDKMLMPSLSEAEAMSKFTRMIDECLNSRSTQLNFFIHNLAQLRFTTDSSNQLLLSFIPKTFSLKADGRIESLDVVGCFKFYQQEEKQYYYQVKVIRENQLNLPTFIRRTFEEFYELQRKLNDTFPTQKLRTISKSSSFFLINFMQRKNTREVADRRLADLRTFVKDLLDLPPEVRDCNLIYTFFHPILRDQIDSSCSSNCQTSDMSLLSNSVLQAAQSSMSSSSTFGSQEYSEEQRRRLYLGSNGQVKLSLVHKNKSLIIVVMHAKNLCFADNPQPPNAYAKTYLVPDTQKITKRKTRIVKQNCHPTFMELIVYSSLSLSDARQRTLRVSIWHSEGVVHGKCHLGSALIPLNSVDLSSERAEWYPLKMC